MISAIILGAGKSTRMGEPKLLLPFRGSTVFECVIRYIKASAQFGEIIAVVSAGELYKIASKTGIKVIVNEKPELGLSSSLKLGIEMADKNTKAFMFFSGDQPKVSPETIKTLVEQFQHSQDCGKSIIVPKYNGNNGMPTIFSSSWKNELFELLGDTGGREIIRANPNSVNFISIADSMEGLDIDTKEDYDFLLQKNK